ncbi:MAG: ATP-binding protein [Chlorobi bacterium]|nr:ATP-binding protein [Chlorobiota bacterium]
MFYRNALSLLTEWKLKKDRKPLIIRGARQVGKTTVVEMFSKEFSQYIYLNLEIPTEKKLFDDYESVEKTVEAIFFHKEKHLNDTDTLLFIDEIQNSPKAVSMFRYFYEDYKNIFVIGAGSLLEVSTQYKSSFPVGRVEYLFLHPFSFHEFLAASDEKMLLKVLNEIPFPDYAHQKLMERFRKYMLIGGMPEIVKKYLETKDILSLNSIFESLLFSYLDDVEKYAKNEKQMHVLRFIMRQSFAEAGGRIKFQNFGGSGYSHREISEGMRMLEKAMLIRLLHPTLNVKPPLTNDFRKSPKLFLLDTGMVNYFAGLQKEVFGSKELTDVYEGKIAEHVVAQELLAYSKSLIHTPTFWVREKRQSSAEIDFVYQYENMLIPIEVKAGKTGKLRSLLQYMDLAPHNFAVRIFSGKLSLENAKTINGKNFRLLNLPFYLIGKLEEYIDWAMKSKTNF